MKEATVTKKRSVRNIFVRVQADSGLTGFGEGAPSSKAFPGETQETALIVIRRYLAPALLDQDPLEIPRIIELMDRVIQGHNAAKAAIDLALHDLVGKAHGVPVGLLLGGVLRDRMPVFELLPVLPPEESAELARKLKEDKVSQLKVKVGVKDDADLHRLKAVRDAVGNSAHIKADANQKWTVQTAIDFLTTAQRDGWLDIIEQPLPAFDHIGVARLKESVSLPIMADESILCLEACANLIRESKFDVLNIKISRLGGLYKAKKLAEMCDASGIKCMSGAGFNSKLLDAAGCHLFSSSSAMVFQELKSARGFWLDDSITSGLSINDGMLEVPKGPGLGIEVDEAIFEDTK